MARALSFSNDPPVKAALIPCFFDPDFEPKSSSWRVFNLGGRPRRSRPMGILGKVPLLDEKAGHRPSDHAILPAGTGHQCLGASLDYLVVGAYPPSGTYDEYMNVRALKTIPKVGRPRKDLVYGPKGLLLSAWKRVR